MSSGDNDHIREIKEKIKAVFKIVLGGDDLAAEYLLLNLISRVHTRETDIILGNIATNLTGLDTVDATAITKFIKAITPLTLAFPVSL